MNILKTQADWLEINVFCKYMQAVFTYTTYPPVH